MIDILILGAGWTSTFLIPLCEAEGVSYAATTRSGSNSTISFNFPDDADFSKLPDARTVLVTFPLQKGWSAHWIALGTTSIWGADGWSDRHTPYTKTDRALAEDEFPGTVLCLSGLWGGPRNARRFVLQAAASKAALEAKDSLHLIHGQDVARAILAVHRKPSPGRWLLTDGRVYDWWELASAWSPEHAGWVRELMKQHGIRALPRDTGLLRRMLDSSEFWETHGIEPEKARV
ncbi:hypothetical protein BDZ89DRAFT_1089377 [Hymenopellis radicata]|nr:hypothetical protein BDZ89DRAFT_1089377 [Hymenopellis radicata]